jgi:hypothetical protein
MAGVGTTIALVTAYDDPNGRLKSEFGHANLPDQRFIGVIWWTASQASQNGTGQRAGTHIYGSGIVQQSRRPFRVTWHNPTWRSESESGRVPAKRATRGSEPEYRWTRSSPDTD